MSGPRDVVSRGAIRRLATMALLLAGVGAAIGSDGGSSSVHAPPGPVSSRSPLPAGMSAQRVERLLASGQARRVLGGLARDFSGNPGRVDVAVLLARAARESGRMDWLEDFARAVVRRHTTAATELLLAEIAYEKGGFRAGIDAARAAQMEAPDNPEVAISYASAIAASGSPAPAFSLVYDWAQAPGSWSKLSTTSLRRLATLTASVASSTLGDSATAEWLRKSWASGDASSSARALAFASTLARASENPVAAEVFARRAVARAEITASPRSVAASLMNAADASEDPKPLVASLGGTCSGIPAFARDARADCVLSALHLASRRGDLGRALDLHASFQRAELENPLLVLRAGTTVLQLLELTGRFPEAAQLARRSVAAASAIGDDDLLESFLARLENAEYFAGRGDHSSSTTEPIARPVAINAAPASAPGSVLTAQTASAPGSALIAQTASAPRSALTAQTASAPGSVLTAQTASAPSSILAAATRGIRLEEEGRNEEALRAYESAIASFAAMRERAGMPAVDRSLLNSVWQDMSRRAIGISLSTGDASLAIDLLEQGRSRDDQRDLRDTRHVRDSRDLHELRDPRGLRDPDGSRGSRDLHELRAPRDVSHTHDPRGLLDLRAVVDGEFGFAAEATVVVYAFGRDGVWAIAARRGEEDLFRLPVRPSSVRSKVSLWRELAKYNASEGIRQAIEKELIATLIAPVFNSALFDQDPQATGKRTTVYVVPDDVLHLLPFATLVSSAVGGGPQPSRPPHADGPGVIVVQVPSVMQLGRVLATPARTGPLVGFAPRPGRAAREEMAAILQSGGEVFAGGRATESAWNQHTPRAAVVHFGGHALDAGNYGERGMLQLHPDRQADGTLTLAELETLELTGATVVLLACDTATRSAEPGSAGYFSHLPSLGEVLLQAGARSVVGNLWPITEEDARLFAIEFYKAGGATRGAIALEEARAELRRRYPEVPRRWAGAVWLGAADRGEAAQGQPDFDP